MSSLNMEIKSVVVGHCIGAIIGLLFFMETTVVMGIHNSTDNNCIEMDCLKEKLKRMCMDGAAPSYLDCENILRCINTGEQEIMRECVKGYPADNESFYLSSFQSSTTTAVLSDIMRFCRNGCILINLLDISVCVHCNISLCLF